VTNTQLNLSEMSMPVQPGQILADRYEILAHLGSGGMSSVFKARDVLVNETIALKIISPSFSREGGLRDKFKQEVLVARRLTHPNIVRIYDIGEHEDLLFISMELIEGQTVADVLDERKRFTVEQFLLLFSQFAAALAYIHSQQILHRDIKPQNLMYDKAGNLRVMDFGIARDMTSSATTPPTRIGTPPYMSPELLKGEPLTPASDIYSAGVMFYELLTGTRPFRKGTLRERMSKGVPRPSRIVRGIPSHLDQMIHTCLQIRPADRFQSVEELISFVSQASHTPTAGTLSDLLQNYPPSPADVLPVFVKVVQQLGAIHADPSLRPVLSPTTIQWSPQGVQIKTTSAAEEHHTLAVDCKYLAFDDFSESTDLIATSAQSNVYLLGFMFFEVLLGQNLFRSQFAQVYNGDANFQWLNWHSDVAKSAKPLKELLLACPPPLSDIIEAMMQKDARLRPDLPTIEASLTTVLQELRQSQNAALNTVRIKRRWSSRAKQAFAKAGRVAIRTFTVITVTLLVACFIGAGGWFIWKFWQAASPAPDLGTKQPPPPAAVSTATAKSAVDTLLPKTFDSGTGLMVLISTEALANSAKVPAFYMDKYEVTNRLYKEFCDSTRRRYPLNPSWDPHYFDKPNYPVINVSWNDARAYTVWAGKRLPTEAEWEMAAGGPERTLFPWGNDFQKNAANLEGADDGFEHTASVGSFELDISPFGVMDMAGNVSEWVGASQGQIARGGAMNLDESSARLTNRDSRPAAASPGLGFRCAADVQTILNALLKQ
jgi:serine/threonine protein kinase/formylglycine-generating enzyme required for sulfatase activity